jgi:hypothetical protein
MTRTGCAGIWRDQHCETSHHAQIVAVAAAGGCSGRPQAPARGAWAAPGPRCPRRTSRPRSPQTASDTTGDLHRHCHYYYDYYSLLLLQLLLWCDLC